MRRPLSSAMEFAESQAIDQIWAVLDTPILYRLAHRLSLCLDKPLVTTVWDPPEGVCLSLRLDSRSRKTASRDFSDAMSRATRSAVTSETMAAEYSQKYPGTGLFVLRNAPPLDVRYGQVSPTVDGEHLIIGFCGSLYASREWDALVAALDRCDWTIAGKPVKVQVFGRAVKVRAAGAAHVEFFGWRGADEINKALSKVTIGYLPYWFDPAYRDSVRLCFPTKLTTYLSSRIPVFYHGPHDSSPTRFFSQYRAGVCCHSLAPRDIVEKLTTVATADRESMISAGQTALAEELNRDVFMERFANLMGVSRDQLDRQDDAFTPLTQCQS